MSTRPGTMTRRTFTQATAAIGAGAVLGQGALALAKGSGGSTSKRRYAIVGVGWRARVYTKAILETHADHCELVGICDTNPGRMGLVLEKAKAARRPEPKAYAAMDFDQMIAETMPDVVIVTPPDGFHHDHICRAINLGCDVMTEKPMTIDAEKCQQILDTKKKTGRRIQVMFNYRYMPSRTQVKELLMGGVIGDILSVDFHWMLDTWHGADYFRRWHSNKAISGGLMLHKATHHFDLVNWWLSAIPVRVRASGKREFYTPATAKRLGLKSHHERCQTCPEKKACGLELDIAADPALKALYLDQEKYDGYFRDRCVFRPDINIEDTMNVIVDYDTGATLSYSLNAMNGWEGYAIAFNGTQGRLEYKVEERVVLAKKEKGDDMANAYSGDKVYIRVFPLRKPAYTITPQVSKGAHGGGDALMFEDALRIARTTDRTQRAADERAGAYSILVGVAANRCFETGQTVAIADLVKDLKRPDYPTMPTRQGKIVMPPKANMTDV
jgi:predicted dehydrogenase